MMTQHKIPMKAIRKVLDKKNDAVGVYYDKDGFNMETEVDQVRLLTLIKMIQDQHKKMSSEIQKLANRLKLKTTSKTVVTVFQGDTCGKL